MTIDIEAIKARHTYDTADNLPAHGDCDCYQCVAERDIADLLAHAERVCECTKKKLAVEVLSGVEGPSLYFDGYRVAGPKPWGGGEALHVFEIDLEGDGECPCCEGQGAT